MTTNEGIEMQDLMLMNGRAMRWVYRTVPLVSSVIVAAASFALSFVALRDVAAELEAVPASLAWLVPIVIDGGVMCASAVIWAAAATGRKRQVFPFAVVFVLVGISVVVNAAHAGPAPLAKLIAALPPLVLLATLELVAITTRSAAVGAAPRTVAPLPPMPAQPAFLAEPAAREVHHVASAIRASEPSPRPGRNASASRAADRTPAGRTTGRHADRELVDDLPSHTAAPVDIDAELLALEATLDDVREQVTPAEGRRTVRVRATPPE